MSMEMYVFSDRTIGSMTEWQNAIYEDGFDIKLYEGAIFEELDGFLPMRLDGAGTGVEVSPADGATEIDALEQDGVAFDHKWQHALAFCWGGDLRELIVAQASAASYARATQGVIYDFEEGKFFSPTEMLELAREVAVAVKDQLGPPRYQWENAG